MSHKKFGPDRFSRFDVYCIQTNIQTSQIYIQMFAMISQFWHLFIILSEGYEKIIVVFTERTILLNNCWKRMKKMENKWSFWKQTKQIFLNNKKMGHSAFTNDERTKWKKGEYAHLWIYGSWTDNIHNWYHHLYLNFACLSGFVCIHDTSKRLNQSGPNFVWNLTWPLGRFMNKDNIYIDMQAGINLEVLRKGANSTISVVCMAFYPLDCC